MIKTCVQCFSTTSPRWFRTIAFDKRSPYLCNACRMKPRNAKNKVYFQQRFQENKKRIVAQSKLWKRTFTGVVSIMYERMKKRIANSNRRYFGLPLCSKKEFFIKARQSRQLRRLYCAWIQSGCHLQTRPTVDRNVESLGYALSNIQFLSYRDNSLKQYQKQKGKIPIQFVKK